MSEDNNYRGIGSRPVGPGETAQKCGSFLALSQGNETKSGLQMVQRFVGERASEQLTDIVGGDIRLRELTDRVNNLIDRDGETISKIRNANLYNEWIDANRDYNTARARVIYKARQNIIPSTQFQTDFMQPDIDANLRDICDNVIQYLTDVSVNFYTLDGMLTSGSSNLDVITNLYRMKEKTLFDTVGNIELYEKKYNVDLRKNIYDFERNAVFDNVYNIMQIIYYSLFAIFIIFGNFMKDQLYKNTWFYVAATMYLLFPFSLKYIFAGIIYIYEYIMGLFGFHKEVYTYSDIVRASNIDNIYTAPVPSLLNQKEIETGYKKFVENPNITNMPL